MAVKSFPPVPSSLRSNTEVFDWMVKVTQTLVNQGAAATLAVAGLVKQAAAVSDAAASSVSVTTADAPTVGGTYDQAEVQAIADLANELKGDVNQLVSDVNAIKDQLNALLTSERNAGQLNT